MVSTINAVHLFCQQVLKCLYYDIFVKLCPLIVVMTGELYTAAGAIQTSNVQCSSSSQVSVEFFTVLLNCCTLNASVM